MALTAATLARAAGGPLEATLALVVVGMIVAGPSMAVWALFGAALARVFRNDRARRWINWGLAALLVATIPFMFRS